MSDKPVNSQMNENDLKLPPLADTDGFMEEISSNLSSDSTSSSVPSGKCPAEGPNPALPAASSKSPASSHSVENPHDETLHTSASQDDRDQIILMLESKKQALEIKIQDTKDFANEVVMEVTKKLQEIQGELKMLRQDKQDRKIAENVRRRLEECTNKQMSEMEQELLYTTRTLDEFDIRIRQLEEENLELLMDLTAAELEVIESAAKLEQAVATEEETLKKRDLMSAEKILLRDQLNYLKSQVAELNNQIEKTEECRDQFKVLLKHEERETKSIEEQIENLHIERKKDDAPALKGKAVLQDKAGAESRKRERECIICLTEGRCVLFLPCKHQLLCGRCNEIHKNEGMNNCLICRTVIEQRISVRFRYD